MRFSAFQRGFTILEILIAVAIFSLVSTATFFMLQKMIKASDIFDENANYLVELQRAKRLLQQDFSQIIHRTIRDEFGEVLPAVMSEDMSWGTAIELSKTGRNNPLNKARSDLQRLRYFFDDNKLIRRTWKRLDRAPEAEYLDQVVLENIKTWQVRFLNGQQWIDSWPSEIEGSEDALPNAIEITLSVSNERKFRWLFTIRPETELEPK